MTMPDTLPDWLRYLESLHPNTIALGLDRVDLVKQRMNLQPKFPVIVVGGTNGKGSVCAMLEAILDAAGYRTACYTSPHLLNYNERVRINKQAVSDQSLCASFAEIEKVRGDIPLTYFEFSTLAAMQLFMGQQVDVAILEVGLGGRLDAVNVFEGDCSIVSSVDIDHTDYLGETREQIAFEKAGIFRQGRVAICGDLDVPAAFVQHAEMIGARLLCVGRDFGFHSHQGQWDYHSLSGTRTALPYPALRGEFQLLNASAVLAALDVLKPLLPVSMSAIRRGFTEVQLTGRFQFIPGRPQLILDVAHNPHAARALAKNLASMPPCPHRYAIFGMLKDKDGVGVAKALDPYIDTWLIAGIDVSRGASAEEMMDVLHQAGVSGNVVAFPDIAHALAHACNVASENDRITAFGSFYTVAEVMAARSLRVQ